jgi:hypothetical protein
VTRLETEYKIGPEVDVAQLLHTEQQRKFMLQTGLGRSRPDAVIEFTFTGGYPQMEEIIKAHGYDLARRAEAAGRCRGASAEVARQVDHQRDPGRVSQDGPDRDWMGVMSIVIVGAGPNLGAAVARRFGRDGLAVGRIPRNRGKLETLTRDLIAQGVVVARRDGATAARRRATGSRHAWGSTEWGTLPVALSQGLSDRFGVRLCGQGCTSRTSPWRWPEPCSPH